MWQSDRNNFTKIILLTASILIVMAPACKKKETKKTEERSVNVRVQSVEEKALRPFVETIGTLNPNEEVIVSAEVDGILKDVRVDEGTVVSKGMLLSVIDDTDYSLEVKRAEAALRQAQATFENTKLEFGRKQSLYKEQLVTQQQFDDVSTRLSLAEADVERARAALSLAKQKQWKKRRLLNFIFKPKPLKIKIKYWMKKRVKEFFCLVNPEKGGFQQTICWFQHDLLGVAVALSDTVTNPAPQATFIRPLLGRLPGEKKNSGKKEEL